MKRFFCLVAGLLSLTTVGLGQVELNRGLVASYPFNGDALDASGHEIHGVVYDATLTSDRSGTPNSAYLFDGTLSHIVLNDPNQRLNFDARSQDYSVSVWVQFTDGLWPGTIFIDRGSNEVVPSSITIAYHPVRRFYVGTWDAAPAGADHPSNVGATSVTVPVEGMWYHLVMIVNNRMITLYVNGVAEEGNALAADGITPQVPDGYLSTLTNETERNVGRSMPGSSSFFTGKIDDLRIYERALNEDEVLALYNDRTIVVNSTGDDADSDLNDMRCWTGEQIMRDGQSIPECTLRAAIETANALDPGQDAPIEFNIEGEPSILVTRPLPIITHSLSIDGTTQPIQGRVELNGLVTSGNEDAHGLALDVGLVSIRGLIIHSFGGYGIHVMSGLGHQISGNSIGLEGFDPVQQTLSLNDAGGIQVSGNTFDTVIGGWSELDWNRIGGGILVAGNEPRRIRILKNELILEENQDEVLIDLSEGPLGFGDGPSCAAWDRANQNGPNAWMPPPRFLLIRTDKVTGISQPNARVILYRVVEVGTGHKRYFARHIQPVADAQANSEGVFEASGFFAVGDRLTATAMDPDGNTSELVQLKRPLVFVPDIGGTWLQGADGTNYWPPNESSFESDETIMARLEGLAMDESGRSINQVDPFRVLERFANQPVAYNGLLGFLEANGYPGHVSNGRPAEQDMWRFPYDWRRNPDDVADDLHQFLGQIAGEDNGQAAWACEVDLVTHGYGGLVASAYLRKYPSHSRTHTNRFIAIGTPFLGSPHYAALHTRGDLLGIGSWGHALPRVTPHWGRITRLFRNIPAAYSLLPAKAFFAGDNTYYLENIESASLFGWDASASFLTQETPDHRGLARNSMLLYDQQALHDRIDDWRDWTGPPQLYRMSGNLFASTPLYWINLNRFGIEYLPLEVEEEIRRQSSRIEDPSDHTDLVIYREGQSPILEGGDGVVLNDIARYAGPYDSYGNISSPWLRYSYSLGTQFQCTHWGLITDSTCREAGTGAQFANTLQYVLDSDYQVKNIPSKRSLSGPEIGTSEQDETREIFYVLGSAPILVTLEDGLGHRTGPVSPDSLNAIAYGIPNLGYWAGITSVTLSIPTDSAYTLHVNAPVRPANVEVIRLSVAGDTRETIVYITGSLSEGGSLKLTLAAGGTAQDAAFDLDTDGDGVFEGQVAPVLQLAGSAPGPAIPVPRPYVLQVERTPADADTTVSITLPDTGSPWQWELTGIPAWIQSPGVSGTTPSTIDLILSANGLSPGVYVDTLLVTLSIQDYSGTYPVIIRMNIAEPTGTVGEEGITPDGFALGPNYPNPFTTSTHIPVTVPSAGPVRLELLNVLGERVRVLHDGYLPEGTHTFRIDGRTVSGGLYLIRLISSTDQIMRPLMLVK